MTNRRLVIALAILALLAAALVAVSLSADRGDAALSAKSESVVVPYKKPFMWKKCASESGNNCWWRDTDGIAPNMSFYAIPVGTRKCIHYWRPKVNRKYGFCTRPDAKVAQ